MSRPRLRQCVKRAFPQLKGVEVHVFGSFANGLSTWTSDVDLVVTGMLQPERSTGGEPQAQLYIQGGIDGNKRSRCRGAFGTQRKTCFEAWLVAKNERSGDSLMSFGSLMLVCFPEVFGLVCQLDDAFCRRPHVLLQKT